MTTAIDSSRFLGALQEPERRWLIQDAKRCTGRKGQLFRWSGDTFFVITCGRFKVIRTSPSDGRELTLLFLTPGDGFETIGLLDGEPHDATAVALDDYEVIQVPAARLLGWCQSSPTFDRAMLQYLGHQLDQISELATDLTFLDTHMRLAKLILNHLDSAERGVLGAIRDLSDENVASLIGTVRKVVNRHLTHLRERGIIESKRGHLQVLDIEALAERATTALRRRV